MKTHKPAWWQLYAIFPLMFVLLGIEHWWPVPGVPAEAADAGIVVLSFFAMLAWVQLNGGLIEQFDFDPKEYRRSLKITVCGPNTLMDGSDEENRKEVEEERYEQAEKKDGRGIKTPVRSLEGRQRSGKDWVRSNSINEEDKWFLN